MLEAALAAGDWAGDEREREEVIEFLDSEPVAAESLPAKPGLAIAYPDDLFDIIAGLQGPKRVCRLALEAPEQAHVLLVGDPGSAKSLFLLELERVRGALMAIAGNTTRAGVNDFLFDHPECRILLVDEIDKPSARRDLNALLPIMEGGLVTQLQGDGRFRTVTRRVKVFAAANSIRRLPAPLLDRFVVVRLKSYSPSESREVMGRVLEAREGVEPKLAATIARTLSRRTSSIRRAVQVARLANGDPELARALAARV